MNTETSTVDIKPVSGVEISGEDTDSLTFQPLAFWVETWYDHRNRRHRPLALHLTIEIPGNNIPSILFSGKDRVKIVYSAHGIADGMLRKNTVTCLLDGCTEVDLGLRPA